MGIKSFTQTMKNVRVPHTGCIQTRKASGKQVFLNRVTKSNSPKDLLRKLETSHILITHIKQHELLQNRTGRDFHI
jgi:hypothetical protein